MTEGTQRRLTTIVAADIAGFSRLVGNDEEAALSAQRHHRSELIEPLLRQFHGRIANTAGDSFLFEFSSAVDAVRFAVAMQTGMAERNRGVPAGERIEYRIGINVGDVVSDGDDLLGDGVNVAARLEALAPPGGICISGSTHEQVRRRLEIAFDDMGLQRLKNIAEPVRVYRIANGSTQTPAPARPGKHRWLMVGVGLALVMVISGLFAWQQLDWTEPNARSSSTSEEVLAPIKRKRRLTIAVLPFESKSDADRDKWLGEGIAEDIAVELSRFRDIGVAARGSSARFGPQPIDLQALKRELGADFALQGSVHLRDGRLRMALQLVDTQTGTNSWAERYDRPYEDVLSVRADIIKQISARLFTEAQDAAGSRFADRDPRSLDVFEQVLRARWSYNQFTRQGAVDALALAERAVELDPNYAPAWEILSRAVIQFYVQPYDRRRGDPATLERSIEAARKAVALDPRHSTAVATLGVAEIWAGRHEAGLQDLRQAIELNPSDSVAVGNYADALSRAGFQEQALAAWAEREKLDPFAIPLTQALVGRSHILLGNYEKAYELTSECLRRAPKILPCHLFHIMAASGLKKGDEVAASVDAVRRLAPRFSVSGWRNIIKFGNSRDAETLSAYLIDAGLAP